jgi:histidine triad (HIT) family protein
MIDSCIFCKIVAGQAPGEIVYRDERVTAFKDVHPAAPVHLLIVPNLHLISLNRINEEDASLLGHMIIIARKLAEQQQVSQNGYRLIFNTGPDAGQTVYHLHLHLLGGERLGGLAHK